MNINMTSMFQNEQLNAAQVARANLVAGTLLNTRQLSYEQGLDEWIEELLGSYVCQSSPIQDFHEELYAFAEFVEKNLIGDNAASFKHSICNDIEITLRAMEVCTKPTFQSHYILKAA